MFREKKKTAEQKKSSKKVFFREITVDITSNKEDQDAFFLINDLSEKAPKNVNTAEIKI